MYSATRISGVDSLVPLKNMERFANLRVIFAQGPHESSLYRSNFSISAAEASTTVVFFNIGNSKESKRELLELVSDYKRLWYPRLILKIN